MTTVADWILETKNHLYGPFRATLDELAAPCTDTATTVTLTYTTLLRPNMVLSCGGEDMLVRSFDQLTKQAVVRRGWRGSTAVAHALADEVEVNPRFTDGQINQALLNDVRSWPTSLYQTTTKTWTITAATENVDTDLDMANLLRIAWTGDSDLAWHSLPYARMRPASSGKLRLELGDIFDSGTVSALFAVPFDLATWTLATDLVNDVGLALSMLDLGPLGAAIRLLALNEAQRSDRAAQGEPRIAQESPPGHALQTASGLMPVYRRRIGEEITRLRDRNGLAAW